MFHYVILQDEKYMVIKPTMELSPDIDFWDYCDIFRQALSTFNDELNRFIMNDGSGVFFGCIHLP